MRSCPIRIPQVSLETRALVLGVAFLTCPSLQRSQTSLHMSVLGGSTDVTQTLLDHCVRHSTHRFGETLYIADAEGCTAMFLAAKHETVVR